MRLCSIRIRIIFSGIIFLFALKTELKAQVFLKFYSGFQDFPGLGLEIALPENQSVEFSGSYFTWKEVKPWYTPYDENVITHSFANLFYKRYSKEDQTGFYFGVFYRYRYNYEGTEFSNELTQANLNSMRMNPAKYATISMRNIGGALCGWKWGNRVTFGVNMGLGYAITWKETDYYTNNEIEERNFKSDEFFSEFERVSVLLTAEIAYRFGHVPEKEYTH